MVTTTSKSLTLDTGELAASTYSGGPVLIEMPLAQRRAERSTPEPLWPSGLGFG
jgi:hypothetical protein